MSDPLTTRRLPERIDPRKLAARDAELAGHVPTERMHRLRDAALEVAPEAEVSLSFYRDEERRAVVEGDVHLRVQLKCQRCLQAATRELDGHLRLGVVWSEGQAADLPRWLEPWLVESDSADLHGMIEDELLLTLPIVAYHPENECPVSGSYSTGEQEESGERRDNPFSVLEQLKKH